MSIVNSFTLTDLDLLLHFINAPFTPAKIDDDTDPTKTYHFAPFEHPELIKAIFELKYAKAYRLLNELTGSLSPQEAAAASLCALLGSDRLLNAVLDHSPPLAEFQFEGVGCAKNLVDFAVKFDLSKKLQILLRRGANPNKVGETPSPLEIAFTEGSYSALWELLESPDLEIELTEPILDVWGSLSASLDTEFNASLLDFCCQTICTKLAPEHKRSPFIYHGIIPPQLRVRHALAHGNAALAARICETNSLTEEDHEQLRIYFDGHFPLPFHQSMPFSNDKEWSSYVALLKIFIRLTPNYQEDPVLRRAIACAVAGNPTQDDELIAIAAQLPSGPIHLKIDDIWHISHDKYLSFIYNLMPNFFSKWDELFGARLPAALDLNGLTPHLLVQPDAHVILTHCIFTGTITDEKWDELLAHIVNNLRGHDNDCSQLFQQGKILSHIPADKLLSILPQLSIKQRADFLLHVKKKPSYDL